MDENLSGLEVQEEAHFYHIVNEFNQLVAKHGLDFIISKSPELSISIIQWMNDDDSEIDWDHSYNEGKEWWEYGGEMAADTEYDSGMAYDE